MAVKSVLVLAFVISVVSAMTDEERTAMRTASIPLLMACGSEHGITKEQLMTARETKNLDSIDSCFFACFFKKGGMMDDKGLYDSDNTIAMQKKYIKNEDDLKKLADVMKACSSVNEQTVSDGAKGCERAKLLMKCFLDNKTSLMQFST